MTKHEPHFQPVVFIIESPNQRDVLEGREEGTSLSPTLKLAGIPHRYFRVCNLEMFKESFAEIVHTPRHQIEPTSRDSFFVPYLHISAHGNKSGLHLTSGEFISWDQLRSLLLMLGKESGYLRDGMSWWQVCFSVCMGSYAQEMFSAGPPYPCFAVVGPEQFVEWSDSLIAFITFYHHVIFKQSQVENAVRIMNVAAGLNNVFVATLHPTF